ncbi:hypothetical protein [Fodinicola acaciae]|uniref:hypothetical protein n=1 Tax=Fodinicola acaciae TaxID=2681555 RepID=UPI0013D339AD|nr:hypothetical protein [Fodinicola acaciae]
MKRSSQVGRNLLVWLHIVASVGWMSQALVLLTLMVFAMSNRVWHDAAVHFARLLDKQLLAVLANASAFTGFMLSALTMWGYFRYWWVLAKASISVVQLTIGVFFLDPDATPLSMGAAALMASALGLQAWMSVAKPWKRTPWSDARRLPPAPQWMFAACIAVVVADLVLGLRLGFPSPLFELIVVIAYPVWRSRRLRQESAGVVSRVS